MNMEDLEDMKFSDVIEQYFVLYSPECDYIYGVAHSDVLDEMYENYNITEDDSVSVNVDSLLSWKSLENYYDDFLEMDKIDEIMKILNIKKKEMIVDED